MLHLLLKSLPNEIKYEIIDHLPLITRRIFDKYMYNKYKKIDNYIQLNIVVEDLQLLDETCEVISQCIETPHEIMCYKLTNYIYNHFTSAKKLMQLNGFTDDEYFALFLSPFFHKLNLNFFEFNEECLEGGIQYIIKFQFEKNLLVTGNPISGIIFTWEYVNLAETSDQSLIENFVITFDDDEVLDLNQWGGSKECGVEIKTYLNVLLNVLKKNTNSQDVKNRVNNVILPKFNCDF